MALTRIYSKIVFICDGCGDEIPTGEGNFYQALDFMKRNDWVITKNTDKDLKESWRHYCPECNRDAA